jgi:hypothetical protein
LRLTKIDTSKEARNGKRSRKASRETQRSQGAGGGARLAAMIRKLKSGGYRLCSRKVNPKTGRRRTSAPSRRARRPKSMSAPCSISSATNRSGEPGLP